MIWKKFYNYNYNVHMYVLLFLYMLRNTEKGPFLKGSKIMLKDRFVLLLVLVMNMIIDVSSDLHKTAAQHFEIYCYHRHENLIK